MGRGRTGRAAISLERYSCEFAELETDDVRERSAVAGISASGKGDEFPDQDLPQHTRFGIDRDLPDSGVIGHVALDAVRGSRHHLRWLAQPHEINDTAAAGAADFAQLIRPTVFQKARTPAIKNWELTTD
jgi:hypothetical protein